MAPTSGPRLYSISLFAAGAETQDRQVCAKRISLMERKRIPPIIEVGSLMTCEIARAGLELYYAQRVAPAELLALVSE